MLLIYSQNNNNIYKPIIIELILLLLLLLDGLDKIVKLVMVKWAVVQCTPIEEL